MTDEERKILEALVLASKQAIDGGLFRKVIEDALEPKYQLTLTLTKPKLLKVMEALE